MELENPHMIRNTLIYIREKNQANLLRTKPEVTMDKALRERYYRWNPNDAPLFFYYDTNGNCYFTHLRGENKPRSELWNWWVPGAKVAPIEDGIRNCSEWSNYKEQKVEEIEF